MENTEEVFGVFRMSKIYRGSYNIQRQDDSMVVGEYTPAGLVKVNHLKFTCDKTTTEEEVITFFTEFFRKYPIEDLNYKCSNFIPFFPTLKFLIQQPCLKSLTTSIISTSQYPGVDLPDDAFSDLNKTFLQKLVIYGTWNFTAIDSVKILNKMENLKTLTVENIHIVSRVMGYFKQETSSIETLEISKPCYLSEHLLDWVKETSMVRLILNLENYHHKKILEHLPTALHARTKPIHLSFERGSFTDSDAHLIFEENQLSYPCLVGLNLRCTEITIAGFQSLMKALSKDRLPNLRCLSLESTPLVSNSEQVHQVHKLLAASSQLTSLEELRLMSTSTKPQTIAPESACFIPSHFPNLNALSFNYTKSFESFFEGTSTTLTSLSIRQLPSDTNAFQLAKNFPNLKNLELYYKKDPSQKDEDFINSIVKECDIFVTNLDQLITMIISYDAVHYLPGPGQSTLQVYDLLREVFQKSTSLQEFNRFRDKVLKKNKTLLQYL